LAAYLFAATFDDPLFSGPNYSALLFTNSEKCSAQRLNWK